MSKKNAISILILAALTILSIWVFYSNTPQKPAVVNQNITEKKNADDENVKATNLIITETKEGKKFWEVYAVNGNYSKSVGKVYLKTITGNFYKNDEVVLSVEAPDAVYDSVKREVILKNGAKAANNKNVVITAKEIKWTGATGFIDAIGNVKIIQEDKLYTTSDKSVFNADFTNLKIVGNSNSYIYK